MNLRNPRMIGFGISNAQTLKAAQDNAAGAIIGSKFVTLLSEAYAAVGGGTADHASADHAKIADTALDKLFDALSK
jgi:tryptophan synthase alpha chain